MKKEFAHVRPVPELEKPKAPWYKRARNAIAFATIRLGHRMMGPEVPFASALAKAQYTLTALLGTPETQRLERFIAKIACEFTSVNRASLYLVERIERRSDDPAKEPDVKIGLRHALSIIPDLRGGYETTNELTGVKCEGEEHPYKEYTSRTIGVGSLEDMASEVKVCFNLTPHDFGDLATQRRELGSIEPGLQRLVIQLRYDDTPEGVLVLQGEDLALKDDGGLPRGARIRKYTNTLTFAANLARTMGYIIEFGFDGLTRLLPRTTFNTRLENQIKTYRKSGGAVNFALLVVDLDHLREINERKGHLGGDEALKDVGRAVGETIRKGGKGRRDDIACRYGGDEFAIILKDCDVDGAVHFAGRLRSKLREAGITCSIGITDARSARISLSESEEDERRNVFEIADSGAYHSKNCGRDGVCAVTREDGDGTLKPKPLSYQIVTEQADVYETSRKARTSNGA